MRIKNKWGWKGRVDITIYNIDGTTKETVHLQNEIKNGALNAVRGLLNGTASDIQIKYMAWGGSSTANDPAQTTLVSEFGRKQVTSQADGGVGVEVTTVYMSPFEGNTPKIEELGWFAGEATEAADSGLLIARVLYSHQKTFSETINVVRTDTIS